jgi:phage terminase large subunit-like protein
VSRGDRAIEFIERYCRVPQGKDMGQPLRLMGFQKKFIREVLDNPAGTDMGILSIGRKNGKTALIAALVIVFLVGPEARQNSQIISGARSRKQAALVFKLAHQMVNLNPALKKIVRPTPSEKRLVGLPMNVEYEAISAEAGTAHGLSPYLAILDEVGQVKGERDDFVEAIVTAQGAYDDALKLVISTQAPTNSALLSIWIDDARRSNDPKIVAHVYEAPADCDLLDRKAWKAANPALGQFRSLVDFETWAAKAARAPSEESGFRNLGLNQRINRVDPFITKSVWERNAGPIDDDLFYRAPVWGGLDLSRTTDLTAFVLVAEDEDGNWHIKPTFWKPADLVKDHSDRDRTPYDRWAREGLLETPPGSIVDYGFVAKKIGEICAGMNIQKIGFDRWKFDQLKIHLEDHGVSVDLFSEVIQGPKTMSPMLDATEQLFVQGKVRHGNHPVLAMCFAHAVAVPDSNENRKLDKSRSTGRIDGAVGTCMGIGEAMSGDTIASVDEWLASLAA